MVRLIRVCFFYIHSLRIYPHLQDTGGFFVAVFKKTAHFVVPNTGSSSSEKTAAESEEAVAAESSESKEDEEQTTTAEDTAAASTGDKHKLESTEDEPLEGVKRARTGLSRAERYGAPAVKEEPFLFLDANNTDV
jgi:hypothetical protein